MNKDLQDGWKWVKLGDIAFEVSDRIDNPSESGLERFVGLEHMDSESLTVKRWGSTDDVTSAMKLFKKGDMLFARRNAYLKRASMATFDGVCSGDAIVLRQKNEVYVKGLLPLILNMEKLWEFAIANASGSMSKRVKWRDLATFEIPLPPKEEQRRIADMLWAAEDCIVKNEKLVEMTEIYKKTLMNELLTKGIGHEDFKGTEIGKIPQDWKVGELGDVAD
ncbi:MAG: restriction endonuclease subunit S, partial [Candidatus Methanoperedens sp.]|nr:restriction endonuclease subunit S [Candidatus Methanoperedens sp.]